MGIFLTPRPRQVIFNEEFLSGKNEKKSVINCSESSNLIVREIQKLSGRKGYLFEIHCSAGQVQAPVNSEDMLELNRYTRKRGIVLEYGGHAENFQSNYTSNFDGEAQPYSGYLDILQKRILEQPE